MLKVGDKAPDFQISRLSAGKPFGLHQELTRGPVMLVFAKESCPTCRWALPLLDRAGTQASGEKGRMLVVLQELPWVAEQFVNEVGLSSPVLVESEPYPASNGFLIDFVPSAFLIGQDGTIQGASESFQREELASMIERLYDSNGAVPRPFYREADGLPPFRPG